MLIPAKAMATQTIPPAILSSKAAQTPTPSQ